jgi:hypothetical protein
LNIESGLQLCSSLPMYKAAPGMSYKSTCSFVIIHLPICSKGYVLQINMFICHNPFTNLFKGIYTTSIPITEKSKFYKTTCSLTILSQNYRFKPPLHKTTHFTLFISQNYRFCVDYIAKLQILDIWP